MHTPNGDVFPFGTCHIIIAAGAESGHIANLAGLGIGKVIFFCLSKQKMVCILLPKLFWPSWRKKCSCYQEKPLKFEAEGPESAKILRSLEQLIWTVKGQSNKTI